MVLLAERFFELQVTRRQWVGLALLGVGMAALGAAAHGDSNHSGYGTLAIAAFEVGAVGLGVGCAAGCRRERMRDLHGLLLGVAGGIFFGVSDISIKAVTGGSHGMLGLVGPSTFLGILAAIAAFFATGEESADRKRGGRHGSDHLGRHRARHHRRDRALSVTR